MKPSTRNLVLLALNAALWTLNGLLAMGTIQLSAKSGIPVSLEIDPARVKLIIDGKPWPQQSEGWILTPVVIHLPPGQHKVAVERPGYAPHSFRVLLSGGDSLQLKTALEFIQQKPHEVIVTGEGPDIEDITAIIDGGLEQGPLPLDVTDLTAGNHILELRMGGLDGLRVKPYLCSFTVPSSPGDVEAKIHVVRNGKRLKVSGCKRLKDQR